MADYRQHREIDNDKENLSLTMTDNLGGVMEAQINDLILGTLKLPDPCPIRITIDQSYIRLEIGQRDWQWDLNGKFVGAGTSVMTEQGTKPQFNHDRNL